MKLNTKDIPCENSNGEPLQPGLSPKLAGVVKGGFVGVHGLFYLFETRFDQLDGSLAELKSQINSINTVHLPIPHLK